MDHLNTHGQWRVDFAKEISRHICEFEGIQAIVVGGSVARGYADAYSDLELPLFWNKLPDDSMRKDIIATLNAELLNDTDGASREDSVLIDGFQIDLWHNTVADEEEVMNNVLERFATDLESSSFMETVRTGIPLYGETLIQRWKKRAQAYPDELAQRIIQEQLAHFQPGHMDLHSRRDNPTVLYGLISGLQKRMFLVLLALNRRYFPSFKWIYRTLETLPIRPMNIKRRFRRAFDDPQDEAIQDTFQILDEMLALVNESYPQIDITRVRRRLGYRRLAHHSPVHLKRV